MFGRIGRALVALAALGGMAVPAVVGFATAPEPGAAVDASAGSSANEDGVAIFWSNPSTPVYYGSGEKVIYGASVQNYRDSPIELAYCGPDLPDGCLVQPDQALWVKFEYTIADADVQRGVIDLTGPLTWRLGGADEWRVNRGIEHSVLASIDPTAVVDKETFDSPDDTVTVEVVAWPNPMELPVAEMKVDDPRYPVADPALVRQRHGYWKVTYQVPAADMDPATLSLSSTPTVSYRLEGHSEWSAPVSAGTWTSTLNAKN